MLGITHLSFADDLLIFSRGDIESVQALQKCFILFLQTLDLQANLTKSSIYFGGVPQETREQIAQVLVTQMENYLSSTWGYH